MKNIIIRYIVVPIILIFSMLNHALGQEKKLTSDKVMAAAACLRKIPGIVEGKSPEDTRNDNAHFVLVEINSGKLGVTKTIIRLHKGLEMDIFPEIDQSRVIECMQGLRRIRRNQ